MTFALDRRSLLAAAAGLPLTALFAAPRRARADAAASATVNLTTIAGRTIVGTLTKPAIVPAPVVLMVHDWWGANDQFKAMAADFVAQGYAALAIDMFGGKVASSDDEARRLFSTLQANDHIDTMASWVAWANHAPDGNGKVAIVGWGFGCQWALIGATRQPTNASAVYYGKCDLLPMQFARLKGPVIGHFGEQDTFITDYMVNRFEASMKEAGKEDAVYWYDAPHGFADPAGSNYRKADADLAMQRNLEFFAKTLKG